MLAQCVTVSGRRTLAAGSATTQLHLGMPAPHVFNQLHQFFSQLSKMFTRVWL